MSQALLLVLQFVGPPSATEQAALALYERSRQVGLEVRTGDSVSESAMSARPPAYDSELAQRVEADLETARTALVSLDEPRALEALARAERDLRAHPELPQAAWLLAEQLRIAAAAAPNAAEREALERRALALDSARAREFGTPPGPPLAPLPEVRARVEGLTARDVLELDGRRVEEGALTTSAGEHHVRVLRNERAIFASFVRLGEGASALVLPLPPIEPCSSDDVAGVRLATDRPLPVTGTSCARWAVAARAPGGLRIAECFGDRCGPFAFFSGQRQAASTVAPPQPTREASSHLAVNVALGALAAVGATALFLVGAGAFDEEPAPRTEWVYGGHRPAP